MPRRPDGTENLGEDEPVQPDRSVVIPAPGQRMKTIKIWDMTGPNELVLRDVEMHLIAKRAHKVTIPEIGEIVFAKGESIRTELSYKYDREILDDILCASGLTLEKWMPADDASFALALARAEG